MRILKIALVAAAIAVPASAGPITFETAPFGPGFGGPVTESGFTYMTTSGSLFVNTLGNPGQDMEADQTGTGGSLVIFRTDGETFTFNGIDFAAYAADGAGQNYLSLVGVATNGTMYHEFYTLGATSTYLPTYANWTTELPTLAGLDGIELKSLAVVLYAGTDGETPCYGAVDNVNLSLASHEPPPDPVPEPASLALLGAGLFGLARRRRTKKA